jgi:Ca-activated chloride channel family protein
MSESENREKTTGSRRHDETRESGSPEYRLTAYLFDSVSPVGRREVEALLARDPEARRECDELRRTIALVGEALGSESRESPTPFEPQRLERVLAVVPRRRPSRRQRFFFLASVAATLLLSVVTLILVAPALMIFEGGRGEIASKSRNDFDGYANSPAGSERVPSTGDVASNRSLEFADRRRLARVENAEISSLATVSGSGGIAGEPVPGLDTKENDTLATRVAQPAASSGSQPLAPAIPPLGYSFRESAGVEQIDGVRTETFGDDFTDSEPGSALVFESGKGRGALRVEDIDADQDEVKTRENDFGIERGKDRTSQLSATIARPWAENGASVVDGRGESSSDSRRELARKRLFDSSIASNLESEGSKNEPGKSERADDSVFESGDKLQIAEHAEQPESRSLGEARPGTTATWERSDRRSGARSAPEIATGKALDVIVERNEVGPGNGTADFHDFHGFSPVDRESRDDFSKRFGTFRAPATEASPGGSPGSINGVDGGSSTDTPYFAEIRERNEKLTEEAPRRNEVTLQVPSQGLAPLDAIAELQSQFGNSLGSNQWAIDGEIGGGKRDVSVASTDSDRMHRFDAPKWSGPGAEPLGGSVPDENGRFADSSPLQTMDGNRLDDGVVEFDFESKEVAREGKPETEQSTRDHGGQGQGGPGEPTTDAGIAAASENWQELSKLSSPASPLAAGGAALSGVGRDPWFDGVHDHSHLGTGSEGFAYRLSGGPESSGRTVSSTSEDDASGSSIEVAAGARGLSISSAEAQQYERYLRAYSHWRSLESRLRVEDFRVRPVAVPPPLVGDEGLGEEGFRERYRVHPFVSTRTDPLSTFGLDASTASYQLARGHLRAGMLPPQESIRVEEFVNSFPSPLSVPDEDVFAFASEGGPAPFGRGLDLVLLTVKTRELRPAERKDAVLTLAVDTSGSMATSGRLELVRIALRGLVASLGENDRIAIVAFGASAWVVLPHTSLSERTRVENAIDSLGPTGGTNVEAGLDLAYRLADEAQDHRSVHRVILCSDGVANVGARGPEEILSRVEVYARRGIFLTTVGFGLGDYEDALLEQIATRGNGNYRHVDGPEEATRLFESCLPSTLDVLAGDAKIQVEFDPDVVAHYRLLGYEKRDIADVDFRNDAVDAGEVGPGTTVTVLYEISRREISSGSLGTVFLRYKDLGTDRVIEQRLDMPPGIIATSLRETSDRFRFIAAVAEFAELLRGSYFARDGAYGTVLALLDSVSEEFESLAARNEVSELVAIAQRLEIASLSAGGSEGRVEERK